MLMEMEMIMVREAEEGYIRGEDCVGRVVTGPNAISTSTANDRDIGII